MTADRLVSVVIPTYNRAYCLPQTIASVFAQTHQNLEVLVVDDGSTDGTEQVLEQRWANEPRLRYLRQENRGVSAARNLGMKSARADLIALLDSDDTWMPWKLEVQLASLKRFPSAVMVHSEMEGVDENDHVFDSQYLRTIYDGYQRFPIDELYPESCTVADLQVAVPPALGAARVRFGDIFSHSLTGNLAHTSTVLFARAPDGSVEEYDETLRTDETFDFHLRIARRGPVVFLDAPSIRYRRGRTDHLWTPDAYKTYPPAVLYEIQSRFVQTIEPHIKGKSGHMRVSRRELDETLARAHGWTAESALAAGRRRDMLRHLVASLRIRPFQPRLTFRLAYKALLKRPKK